MILTINNRRDVPLVLSIEPLAICFEVPPQSKVEVESEFDISDGRVNLVIEEQHHGFLLTLSNTMDFDVRLDGVSLAPLPQN